MSDHEILEELRALNNQVVHLRKEVHDLMTANDDALAALTTSVDNNTAATSAAVTALGTDGSDDISAGVLAQAARVDANTAELTTATTPPPPPPPAPVPVAPTAVDPSAPVDVPTTNAPPPAPSA